MIPQRCPGCGKFALSLFGQIERLDSYLLEPGGPPAESAGHWHSACLVASSVGGAWAAARKRNLVDVRAYAVVGHVGAWCVLEDLRDGARMGLSDQGPLLVLPPATAVASRTWGTGYRERKGEYNLHLPVPDLIAAIQTTLERDGVCSMAVMFDRLALWPCLQHAEALADARFVYDEELREEWRAEWLSAGAEYNVVVPPELLPHCR